MVLRVTVLSSPEDLPVLELSSRSASPMNSVTTLKFIRQCLNAALEADDDHDVPVSPFLTTTNNNNNKTHETKCGYARREGNTSWQIRYKPFGAMQTGILAGGDDHSSNARVLTSVAVAHFQSNNDRNNIPRTLVLFSLKCTELRHLLKEGRQNLRKGNTLVERIPTLSRLDGGTTIDIAPLLVPILGPVAASTADVVQLIDMAEACSYPEYFDGIICREWKVRPHSKVADRFKDLTNHKWLEAVSVMIRECLQPDLYASIVTSPQLRKKELGTLILEQQYLWKQRQFTDDDNDQVVWSPQIGSAPRQLDGSQNLHLEEERTHIEAKQLMQPYQKGGEARQDQESILIKRPTRQRKLVTQFDATPWTLQQKAKIMKERNVKSKASNKVFMEINMVSQPETKEEPNDIIKPMLNKPGAVAIMSTRFSSRRSPLLERKAVRKSARIKNNSHIKYDDNSRKGDDYCEEKSAKRLRTNQPVFNIKKALTSQHEAVTMSGISDNRDKNTMSDKEEDDEDSAELINVYDNQWQRLDYCGLLSDYKYHDFDPIDFGCFIESAREAIDYQLRVLQEKNLHSVDDEIYLTETRIYAKSMQERRQKSDSERIEKERNREEYEKRVMEYQYYGAKKRSAEDIELEAFLERPVHFSARRESTRNLICPIGSSCDYCSKPGEKVGTPLGAYVCSEILAPCVRLSDIKDAWRESTAGMNAEPVAKGKYKAPRLRRTGRNSNKSQHAFYMLSETKHSLIFIQRYNKGYLKKPK